MTEDDLYESDFPYWFYSTPLTQSGYYTHVLEGQDCDSVIGLTLMVLEGIEEDGPSTGSETFVVWPNPTNGILHIEADAIEKMEVYSLIGQCIMNAEKAESLDLSHLESGVYFLKTSDGFGKMSVIKIIKN